MNDPILKNPQLDGSPFLLEGGDIGILLVHGFTATPVEVRQLAERLHAAGYTVAGPLMAGHATTPDDLNATTWQDWVWSVEQTYHELATLCRKVIVGGESTGALVALYLASRDPEISAVLCYAPAMKLQMSRADLVRLYLAAPFMFATPKPGIDDDGDETWQGYRVNPLKGIQQLIAFEKAVEERLPRVAQPVLIMQGGRDETIAPESGELIAAGVTSAEIETHLLPESPHVMLLGEDFDEITQKTLAFLGRVL